MIVCSDILFYVYRCNKILNVGKSEIEKYSMGVPMPETKAKSMPVSIKHFIVSVQHSS
jgi:hypothetical protein